MMLTKNEALKYLKEQLYSSKSTAKFPKKVIEHSIKVSEVARSFAEKIEGQGKKINVDLVEIGGILHDIGRRDEQSIKHGYTGSVILGNNDWDYELANISANHVLVSRDMAVILSIPKRHYAPLTIEEDVITYTDKVVHDKKLVGLKNRWKYLENKYSGTEEGGSWYDKWKDFAKVESYELEKQVEGFFKKSNGNNPPLIKAIELLGKSFSRIKDLSKRKGITKHSLAISGLSSLIAKNIPEFDEPNIDVVRYAGLLHDIGRGSAWAVEHPLVGRMMLESRNYHEAVVKVTTGHCIFPDELAKKLKFPKPWNQYRPSNVFDKIVTYADKRIYLNQLLPNIETRYKIWEKLYGKGDNFNLWFPEMKQGLSQIRSILSVVCREFEVTPKIIDNEINTILDEYGISKKEAYQILNLPDVDDPIVVNYESMRKI